LLDSPLVLIVALALLAFGLWSRWIEQRAVTAPMLFVALGVITGPLLFDWSAPDVEADGLKTIAELTLALILFTDASQINRAHLAQFERLPLRLLSIGLPLTMVLGAVVALLMFDIGWSTALLLAIILAPTDAALAQTLFGEQRIPEALRHSITVESGLNDGLALPILLMTLAIISAGGLASVDHLHWLGFFLQQLLLGSVIGVVTGRLGGTLIQAASRAERMDPVFQRLSSLALALLTYTLAEHLGGNGFIAAFMAGLFLQSQQTIVIDRLKEFGEAEGQLLSLIMFFLFGLIYVPEALQHADLMIVSYALLSLTLIRLLPVLISLLGSGLSWRHRLFLGWFGPRGIASVLYLLLAIDALGFAPETAHYDVLFSTSVLTVLISVFIHGLSVPLWIRKFHDHNASD
jgi:NhaP-type Na+/H+ or K+/H+ antiporter